MASRDSVLDPIQVRFTEPDDIEKYGNDWFTYDELALITMPGRTLMVLESEIGQPLPGVMDAQRASSIFGDLAGAWLAVRASGNPVAFTDFNPLIMLAEWRLKPKQEEESPGKAESGSPDATVESKPVDTVSLETMPPAESAT